MPDGERPDRPDLEHRHLEPLDREPLDLEQLYDVEVLSLIEAQAAPAVRASDLGVPGDVAPNPDVDPPQDRSGSPMRFRRARGGVLAAAMLGVAEVFEPQPEKQSVVEFAPSPADHDEDPIEFVFVRGAPERSRIIYRPWL